LKWAFFPISNFPMNEIFFSKLHVFLFSQRCLMDWSGMTSKRFCVKIKIWQHWDQIGDRWPVWTILKRYSYGTAKLNRLCREMPSLLELIQTD
jgi:hypothetical protein